MIQWLLDYIVHIALNTTVLRYICFQWWWDIDETSIVAYHVLTGGERQIQPEADRTGKDAAGCSSDRPQWGSSDNLSGRLCCHGLWETPFSHIQGWPLKNLSLKMNSIKTLILAFLLFSCLQWKLTPLRDSALPQTLSFISWTPTTTLPNSPQITISPEFQKTHPAAPTWCQSRWVRLHPVQKYMPALMYITQTRREMLILDKMPH